MPGFDKTGPAGAGPQTGRGMGPCGGGQGANSAPRGGGRGFGRGAGRGFFSWFRGSTPPPTDDKKW